jgi:hypothetical protein
MVAAANQNFGAFDRTIGNIVIAAAGYLNYGSAYVDMRSGNIALFSGPSATVVTFNIDSVVRMSCSATSMDLTGMGNGGALLIKDAGGTTRTVTITALGAWSIV